MRRTVQNLCGFATTSRISKLPARFFASINSPPIGKPDHFTKPAIRLRGYQDECIQSVLSHLEKGYKRLGISLATGSGKTLIDRVPAPQPNVSRTLILVHRRELVEQAARHCSDAYPSKSIDIEMGNLHAKGTADITVASVRSITSGDRMTKFDPKTFKLILVDEAHHIVAPGYMKTLRYFGLTDPVNACSPTLVGVSATLSRFDGLRLSDAIDQVVYHKDYIDMIGEKWLSKVIFTTVKSKADISRVKKAASGDFHTGGLSKAVNTLESNDITVRAWLERAGQRRSTIGFCVDLAHVSDLAAMFRRYGIDARFITGDTPTQVRSARLDAFKIQEYPVLLNCGVFTEGTDIPNIDCVLLARPTKSRNLLVQMIGRGMRLHPGKADCHVIDMVASLEIGVVATPTLFGLDPAEVLNEADVTYLKTLSGRKELETLREARAVELPATPGSTSRQGSAIINFTHYDSICDLINDMSGERHIRAISPFSWVLVGPNRYVLSSQKGDYITIEQDDSSATQYRVTFTQKIPMPLYSSTIKSPFMRPREIAKCESFVDAVHAAGTFASGKFHRVMISCSEAWRKLPATDGQLALLNKFRGLRDPLTAEQITKGKAADMIMKVRFGAKGRFLQLEAARKRRVKAQEKVNQVSMMRQREHVQVGPMVG